MGLSVGLMDFVADFEEPEFVEVFGVFDKLAWMPGSREVRISSCPAAIGFRTRTWSSTAQTEAPGRFLADKGVVGNFGESAGDHQTPGFAQEFALRRVVGGAQGTSGGWGSMES